MSHVLSIAVNAVLSAFGCGALVWLFIYSLRKSPEPGKIIFKWLLTVALVTGEVFFVRHISGSLHEGGYLGNFGPAFFIAISVAAVGVTVGITWAPHIGNVLAGSITSLYDGGGVPPEPKPFYSIALAKRKRNQPLEAVAEIRKQLARFPNDYQGVNLLAAVQAEDLKDLPGAEITLNQFCDSPDAPPRQVAAALTQLADWHLKLAQDTDSAQAALQKIIERFPDTKLSLAAAQRIAHLGGTEKILLAAQDRHPLALRESAKSLGLRSTMRDLIPKETDPRILASELVQHLAQHPLDTEAREQLAVIYADYYHRLDLAAGELNQLAEMPGQPTKSVAHWLNLLADLQIRGGADDDAVRPTLQRIVARFPGTAAAELAQSRLNHLKLEMKGQKETPGLKLGVYEQNIGLKSGLPH
jgi:TolA-binding protein